MHHSRFILPCLAIAVLVAVVASAAPAFEGRINAVLIQGTETTPLLYTVGTNSLRIEVAATNWPNPVDIVNLKSGALTLLFPHNRSFVRVKAVAENSSALRPGAPAMPMPPGGLPPGIGPRFERSIAPGVPAVPATPNSPALPPGVGPQFQSTPGVPAIPAMPNRPALPPGVGPQVRSTPGVPTMPMMPMMPMGPGEKLALKVTGEKTNILDFACEKYELKQRGEMLEVWATEQLFPYHAYRQSQPRRFGPRGIEEQWAGLLTSRKLFPLRAILRYDNGAERFRFEVKSVTPEKLTAADANLFQPPSDYNEIEPLSF